MPSVTAIVSTAALTAAALLNGADAHGYISQPRPDFVPGKMYTDFNAEFTAAQTGVAAFQGKTFNRSPQQNAAEFTAAFKTSGLKSLRELMDKQVPGCGNTNPDTTPRDVSALKTVTFQNNEYKEGFLGSHQGPCEIWFDDVRVFQDDDCAAHYKSYPASMPVDFSKCQGNCMLRFYWLALHSQKWQAYKQCVPIKNGTGKGASGGAASGGAASGDAASDASPAVTKAPATATTKPAAPAPAPATSAPKPATPTAPVPAPAATKKKCARRTRRAREIEA